VQIEAAPEGTVLNPDYPAAVNMYGIAGQRVADIVLGVLSKAIPNNLPAPPSGYLSAIALAGNLRNTRRNFVLYEILAGGSGARPNYDGTSALDNNITNSMNTPIEAIESEFPIMIERYELIPDSGGAGRFRGGLGFRRDYRVLLDGCVFNLRSDRNRYVSPGSQQGLSGAPGQCVLNPGTPTGRVLHSKIAGVALKKGDVVSIRTAGGPGLGSPLDRDRKAVLDDIRNGYISDLAARKLYGIED
jgi:N-methylhydantoinase B